MLNRLGIAQRIHGSFGLLIVLLAAMGAAGVVGLTTIAGLLAEFRASSDQALEAGALTDQVTAVEMAALSYRISHAKPAATAFQSALKRVNFTDRRLVEGAAADTSVGMLVDGIKTDLSAYADAFAQSVTLAEGRQAQVAAMRDTGGQAIDAMAKATAGAAVFSENGTVTLTSEASAALAAMLTSTERYLAGGSTGDFDSLKAEGATADKIISGLAAKATIPDVESGAVAAKGLVETYLGLADKLRGTVEQITRIESQVIDASGARMSNKLAALTVAIGSRQSELGSAGQAETDRTLLLLGAAGGAALLIGLGFALWIGRTVPGSVRAMAGDMRRIAEGDLDAALTTRAAGSELTQMAEALEVFRRNGRAVRDMDALKAEEARQAAGRLAAREAMLQEVRRVVGMALAGDFSGRIAEGRADADLADFVASLNSVMATVEGGIEQTASVLDSLAGADLSRRVEGDYPGVFGRLKTATNVAADTFGTVVRRLQVTSRALKTATGEMLSGSGELADRTTRQAATIEQTAAAMEQLSGTVSSTAARAVEASAKTQAASALADEGGQVMHRATEAMERITTSSGKISSIIALIDDIAFQTNLLALNASVEAARAGEAGKGFAVVAVEVRRLAQSAAQASAEVKSLIEQSGTEVAGGSKLVAQAASKLGAILGAVRENSALMAAISDATRGQAASIAEVNAAIRTMDEMTQHNAALVEESNAAIEQAEGQSAELDRIVEVFRLEAMPAADAPVSRGRARPADSPVAAMRNKIRQAAATFLRDGNAAVDDEWQEF